MLEVDIGTLFGGALVLYITLSTHPTPTSPFWRCEQKAGEIRGEPNTWFAQVSFSCLVLAAAPREISILNIFPWPRGLRRPSPFAPHLSPGSRAARRSTPSPLLPLV